MNQSLSSLANITIKLKISSYTDNGKLKQCFLLFFVFIFQISLSQVKPGIDVLVEENFSLLEGKRVGLITNPTGVSSSLTPTIDILSSLKNLKLVALFGPEHGVRGDVPAGAKIESLVDSITGLPVYSLYGKTRKPTPEMLKGVDVLVYDIQDIGARSYTYINTMTLAMEAAGENNIEFIVLDRPNPLSGGRVEGNVLDTNFRSFIGMFPVPYVYGMTCGEFATMVNKEGWLNGGIQCKLTIVGMKNWKRWMHWDNTGLQWIPTSPHIPSSLSALCYSATGIIGELETVNIGVGYTMPFQLIGAEWINGIQFANELHKKKLEGVYFRPLSYKPFYGKQLNKQLNGVQIHITDRSKVNLTNINLYILETLIKLYPKSNPLFTADSSRYLVFDKVMGTDTIRKALLNGIPAETIIASWKKEIDMFNQIRKKYLLY